MAFHVVMLVKEHLAQYCARSFSLDSEDITLSYQTYDTLDQLVEEYRRLMGTCDAIITSGPVPHTVLRDLREPEQPVLGYFHFDIENFYRIILRESVRRSCLDLSRIGTELLPCHVSLQQAIEEDRLPYYSKIFQAHLTSLSRQEFQQEEEQIARDYQQAHREGKLDYILTYFYSTVTAMEAQDIDCFYLYPSEKEFQRTIDYVYHQISLRQAQKSFPAVIQLSLGDDDSINDELHLSELYTALLEYMRQQQYNAVVKQGNGCFHIYTDHQTVKTMTDGFASCPLTRSIPLVRQLCTAIGYGVGSDFFRAKQNAGEAIQYSLGLDTGRRASYLLDGEGNIKLLSHRTAPASDWISVLSRDLLLSFADRASLSVDTIVKLLSVLRAVGTDQITSQDLMDRLGISLRTANRYLANLTRAGLAQVVGQKPSAKKGRPVSIYSLKELAQCLPTP